MQCSVNRVYPLSSERQLFIFKTIFVMKEKTTNEEMNQVLKEMIQGGSSASDNDRRAGRSYLERLSLQTEDGIAVSSPAPDEQPFSSDQAQQDKLILPDE